MIISRTPFRISFFGGGTDIASFYDEYGGAVLSTTFDKYCYVTVRHLPRFFNYRSHFSYSRTERVSSYAEIEHPLIREAMRFLDIHDIRLTYDADLPARAGLGTSSSFAVGMLNAFYALKGKRANREKLTDDAIYLERVRCNEAGGIQDQIAAAYGGFNLIEIDKEKYVVHPVILANERRDELCGNLLLFFTGFTRISSQIQEKLKSSISSRTQTLREMKALVYEAESILASGASLSDFGRLLHESWMLKRSLSEAISSSAIDDIYGHARKYGALGGKILGAGGGGFLLFYVEKEKQPAFLKRMDDLLHVPFRFEKGGSQIIYYDPEDYEPRAE